MADDTTQRAAFNFLREHLQSQEPFTREEFIAVTGWEKPGTLDTCLHKQYKGLIEKVSDTYFRVTDAFWKFVTWRKFKGHVTQVRRVVTTYEPKVKKLVEKEGEVIVTEQGTAGYRLTPCAPAEPRKRPAVKDYLARLRRHQPRPLGAASAKALHDANRGER